MTIRYRLTCSKCKLDQTHEVYSMESLRPFWDRWNSKHGENMKCVHEYEFEEISSKD
jgi:hypothetical protein